MHNQPTAGAGREETLEREADRRRKDSNRKEGARKDSNYVGLHHNGRAQGYSQENMRRSAKLRRSNQNCYPNDIDYPARVMQSASRNH